MSGLVHTTVKPYAFRIVPTMWITTFIAFLCVSHLNGIRTEYDDLLTKFKILENNLLSALETHVQRINGLEEIVKKQQDTLSDQEKTIVQQQQSLTEHEKTIVQQQQSLTEHEKTMIQQQQSLTEQQELYNTLQNLYNKQAVTVQRHEDSIGTQSARIRSLERKLEIELLRFVTHGPTNSDKDPSDMFAPTSNTSSGPGKDNTKHKTGTERDNNVVCRRRSPSITTPVAFTAVKYNKQVGIGIDQNILFDHIILNDGGGFHALHSIFIAPVAGYYMFSTSTLHSADMTQFFHAGLMHNGILIAFAHSHLGIYDQGAVTVVLKVAAGDEVWISNRDHGPESVEGGAHSSFSGVLLYQL